MSEATNIADIPLPLIHCIEVTPAHMQFLEQCARDADMSHQAIASYLLRSAIEQEIEILAALRREDASGEPSLTLDADTRLRMANDLPPWDAPIVAESERRCTPDAAASA